MNSREDAKQWADESDALEAKPHTVKVTTVRRATHDIARVVFVLRCDSCPMRAEHHDAERATREARRHEAHPLSAAGVVAGVSGE